MDWQYLTFEVKVVNIENLSADCVPRIKITKRWPSYSSNSIPLTGAYVDGGVLKDSEFRRVVIPIGTSELFVRSKAIQLSRYSHYIFCWTFFTLVFLYFSRVRHRRMAYCQRCKGYLLSKLRHERKSPLPSSLLDVDGQSTFH